MLEDPGAVAGSCLRHAVIARLMLQFWRQLHSFQLLRIARQEWHVQLWPAVNLEISYAANSPLQSARLGRATAGHTQQ